MHVPSFRTASASQKGVVILETLIAILIFSISVLAIVGLQAAMVKNTTEAKFRADASYIAQQTLGLMWADPANAVNFVAANVDISSSIPGGTRTVTQLAPGEYQITISWQAPGESRHSFTMAAAVTGG